MELRCDHGCFHETTVTEVDRSDKICHRNRRTHNSEPMCAYLLLKIMSYSGYSHFRNCFETCFGPKNVAARLFKNREYNVLQLRSARPVIPAWGGQDSRRNYHIL